MTVCSTVIPTINRPTLERTVKSALEQDLGPDSHEILVFNNSGQPLPETDWLASPQIIVVDSHANYHYATNKGASMASGKYINLLDDDDYLLPGALKALVLAAELTGCQWVTGSYNLTDDDGNLISVVGAPPRGNLLASLLGGESLHFAASLINREAFLKVGGISTDIAIWNDLDLECQIGLLWSFESIDQPIATVRISGGPGSVFDYSDIAQDYRRIREKVLDSPLALARLEDSIADDIFLRGRACRAYLISTVRNMLAGHLTVVSSRLVSLARLTAFHPVQPAFWRGMFYRSQYHAVDKRKQDEHFAAYHQGYQHG